MAEVPDRYCSNCGHELQTEDRFCPNCGRPVHQTATVPTPEAEVFVPPPPQAGGDDAATVQAPQEGVRRGLSNPYNLGCLGIVGFLLFAVVVAAMIGSVRNGGGGNGGGGGVAEKPKAGTPSGTARAASEKGPPPRKKKQAQGEQQDRAEDKSPNHKSPEPQEPSFASFGDGTYQVGTDVQPGTYRTRKGSPFCYWERLRNFSGGMNGILANGGTGAPGIITIEPTDAGFHSEGCGTWTKLE